MTRRMRFGEKWFVMNHAHFLTDEFFVGRGLEQRGPLTLFIFLIVVEGSSSLA